ncbi:hypothetical protein ACLOJK_037244 [Asimina triloba]
MEPCIGSFNTVAKGEVTTDVVVETTAGDCADPQDINILNDKEEIIEPKMIVKARSSNEFANEATVEPEADVEHHEESTKEGASGAGGVDDEEPSELSKEFQPCSAPVVCDAMGM